MVYIIWYCLTLLSEVSRDQAPNAKLPKVTICESHSPGVWFSSDAPPADGWGLRIGVFSRKFCEGVGESHVHFEGSGPVSLAKKCLISNNLS